MPVVFLIAPVFIHLAMPEAYLAAAVFVPWLVGITVLNELSALCNVGCYARNNSTLVLAINSAAAVVAVAGYVLFIPSYGIAGALGATIAGQVLRLALFVVLGRREAPIEYPFLHGTVLLLVGLVVVSAAPAPGALIINAAWILASAAVLIGAAFGLRLIDIGKVMRLVSA